MKYVGIVGVGTIGRKYKKIIEEDIKNAIYSSSPCQADYVIISTPHKTHYELGMQYLNMGCTTLIDKPMSMDKNEYQKLIDAGAVTAFSKRYHGKLKANNFVFWAANYKRGDNYYNGWRGEYDHILWNQSIHDLDLLVWSFGMPYIVWSESDKRNIHCKLNFPNGITVEYSATTKEDWLNEFKIDGKKKEMPRTHHRDLIQDFVNDKLEKPTIEVVNLILQLL